jgi:hypothetical protein
MKVMVTRFSCPLILFLGMVFLSSPAAAQRLEFSTSQDVALAFYKTADITPNFERWVAETEPYNLTPLGRRPQVMEEETAKLFNEYNAFDPDEDFLTIRTFVTLSPVSGTDDNGTPFYRLDLVYPDAPEIVYFPYEFRDQHFAVMPYNTESVMSSPIARTEHTFLKENTHPARPYLFALRLKPVQAMTDAPYKLDEHEQWVLKTNVASAEIWSDTGVLLWEYSAPWYVAPQVKELNNLYVDPDNRARIDDGRTLRKD